MPSFKQITESLLAVWTQATPAARFGLVALVVLSVAMLAFVGYWSAQPSYVNLISNGDPAQISAVVDELAKQGIDYEIVGAGGVLRVDQRHLAKASLAAKKVGANTSEAASTSSGMGSAFWPKEERQRMANKEKAIMLEDAIRNFESVASAKVILNVPSRDPFARAVAKPTAAVQLKLQKRLSDENVVAIAELVASSVENMDAADVKITDSLGNFYLPPTAAVSSINRQTDFTNEEERKKVAKAESQLLQLFGMGNANVEVSIDYTFIQSDTTSTEYSQSGRVANKENIVSSETTLASPDANGTAGVTANLSNTAAAGSLGENTKSETLINDYLVPETVQHQVNSTPQKNYMTVSVVVNELADGVKQEDGSLNPAIKTKVEQLVRTAVGFNEETDKISVEFAPFLKIDDEEAVVPFDWNNLNEILRNVSLAIAALVVFALGFLTLRRFSPTSTPASVAATDQVSQLNQLNDLARNNPEVFARILKSWAGDKGDDDVTPARNAA